jgi:hypothetical protein
VSGLQQVHVRVIDAATGQPTPCRVRFTDAEGKYYAPYGRLTEFADTPGVDVGGNVALVFLDEKAQLQWTQFAYIDGGCEIALPPGFISVSLYKGPEYVPVVQEIELVPGKLALRFTLERWSDLRQQGWYAGDARAHFLSPPAAVLEGAAEGLDVINVLARHTVIGDYWNNTRRLAYANLLEFSGQQPALQRDGCMVVVNTHNRHAKLGSLALLNCHRIVYPLSFGSLYGQLDNWRLADWCDQCHRKNGLVVWTPESKDRGEALADLILGKVDAMEVRGLGWTDHRRGQTDHSWTWFWYDLLQCGFRVPLVGSSGEEGNQRNWLVRTYARLKENQPFNYIAWIEAIRAGRTFVSNGPLLLLTADGQDPGSTLQVVADRPVRVCAEARCWKPLDHLEIIVNETVAGEATPTGNPSTARLELDLRIPEGGWLAARAWGKAPGYCQGECVYAHTSPIYFRDNERPAPVDQAALQRLHGHLTGMLSWVDNEGRYENDGQRLRLRKVFEDAIQILHKRGAV